MFKILFFDGLHIVLYWSTILRRRIWEFKTSNFKTENHLTTRKLFSQSAFEIDLQNVGHEMLVPGARLILFVYLMLHFRESSGPGTALFLEFLNEYQVPIVVVEREDPR